ncbi:MAG: TRAFs-binding domain-containing protein [Agriterribacter sp.]
MQQQCFVIMPFGKKTDATGRVIDFKIVYDQLIRPAIVKASLMPIIAYEEQAGGIIHKPMYERIMFCEFSITDMTTFNANVFYELGMRHAIRPYTTVVICEEGMGQLPFDVALIRTVMYKYHFDKEKNEVGIDNVEQKIDALAELLKSNDVADPVPDSPLNQTIEAFPFPDLEALKKRSEVFKLLAAQSQALIENIQENVSKWLELSLQEKYAAYNNETEKAAGCGAAKKKCFDNIKDIEKGLGSIQVEEFNIVSALLFAYRATSANKETISLIGRMPKKQFENNIVLHHQLAHAYNQEGEYEKAEKVLLEAEKKIGKHPETNGLLGSIYKKKAKEVSARDKLAERGLLKKAITAYQEGYDSNPADYYPGINLLNLLTTTGADNAMYEKYLPLVAYAIERKVKDQPNDYWAQASGMELEVLRGNKEKAMDYLLAAKAAKYYPWEIASTTENLKRIKQQKEQAGSRDVKWVDEMIGYLAN